PNRKIKDCSDEKTRGTDVWKESRILVLDDIKECFLELSYTDTTEQEKTGKDKKIEPKHVFEWGKKEPEKNRLPEKARFQIALWDEDKKGAVPFSVSIPIFACTLSQTKDGVEPGAKKDSDDKKTEKKKNRQPDRSATTGAVSNKAPASGVQEGVLEGVPA
ncbi:hypothetical protein KAU11_05865, partial [Candidatus Babeliales bacterium]|nr:hypothetical protein [Candidatus Babeliales bacterium]